MSTLYLVDLTAYDPGIPGTTTLRYATRGFTSGPADTPANTFWDGRLSQPAVLRRDLFSAGRTSGPSRVGYGDLVLLNGDGALDALAGYGFDGRAITIWRSDERAPTYPTDFTKLLVGTMESAEIGRETVTIKLRDRQAEVMVPLQTTKYAGDNALPDGLEGIEDDLLGKPKPVCLGKVRNVPAVQVNTAKLIHQVNDGAIASLDAVYDRGVALAAGTVFTTQTSPFAGTDVFYAAAFGNGLYLVGGDDNGGGSSVAVLATSPDGAAWTLRSLPGTPRRIRGIAYGGAVYVAVGGDEGTIGQIWSSTDGTTWTERTSSFGTSEVFAVVYAATLGLFVALGGAGKIATSPDGTTWTQRTSNMTTGRALAVGLGIVVGVGLQSAIVTSGDGITWTRRDAADWPFGPNYSALVFHAASGLFAAAGTSSVDGLGGVGTWAFSEDGLTWIRGDAFATPQVRGIASDGDRLIAILATGGLASSIDATTWLYQDPATSPFGTTTMSIVTNGDGGYVVGSTGGVLWLDDLVGYANAADLEDDSLAPPAGTYLPYLAGGYFRLGAPPAGLVTADVTQKPIENLVPDPESFSAWATQGSITVGGSQADPIGGTAAFLLTPVSGSADGIYEVIPYAQNGEVPASLFVKQGTSTLSVIGIADLGVNRHLVQITWSGGIPVVATWIGSGSGEIFQPESMGGGWWRIAITADGIVATNENRFYILPDPTGTGTLLVFGASAWNGNRPHPYYGPSLNPNRLMTAAQMFDALHTTAGLAWTEIESASLIALDLIFDAELGFWVHEETTLANVFDQLAASIGGWWGVDRTGIFRIAQFTAPSGTPVHSLTAADMLKPLTRRAPNDGTRGLPTWRTIVRWGRVYAVQDSDLALGVTAAHRAYVSKEWREAVDDDTAVQTVHLLAPQTVEDSLLTTEADAQAEATRRQTLRGVQRDLYDCTIPLDAETVLLDLGNVVTITHPRYGLSAGADFRVIGLDPDAKAATLGLTVWGG